MSRDTTLAQAAFGDLSLAKQAGLVLAGTVLIAIAAQFSIFIGPVPLSLQTLAILTVSFALGARLAVATLVVYLAPGCHGPAGLFGRRRIGLAYMMGPTGGFLLGFVAMAWLAGLGLGHGPHAPRAARDRRGASGLRHHLRPRPPLARAGLRHRMGLALGALDGAVPCGRRAEIGDRGAGGLWRAWPGCAPRLTARRPPCFGAAPGIPGGGAFSRPGRSAGQAAGPAPSAPAWAQARVTDASANGDQPRTACTMDLHPPDLYLPPFRLRPGGAERHPAAGAAQQPA
jgi:hypothetical protein